MTVHVIRSAQEAAAIARKHGVCGQGFVGEWPNYSAEETEVLAGLERAKQRLVDMNRWALEHLAAETANAEVGQYLSRWRDLGTMMRREHERYQLVEAELLARLRGGDA